MPLNAWNAKVFKQIGELWGSFVMLDDDTLKDKDFLKGKVLIATELGLKIDRWIKLVVQGVVHDVRVMEESSFSNPDEVHSKQRMEGRKLLQRGAGLEEEEGEEDEDDVLQSNTVVVANEKDVVGENLRLGTGVELAARHGENKKLDRVGGPKLNEADVHLLFDRGDDQIEQGDFESAVGDSVGLAEGMPSGPENQAQPEVDSAHIDLGLVSKSQNYLVRELGQVCGVSKPNLGDSIPIGDQNELGVCPSQIPSINLLVDLSDAAGRKRRRRQLTNLLRIREELSKEPSMVDGSPLSSGESVQAESIQTDSRIVDEVRATMAIGGELNVQFLPNDDVVLKKMIELEVKEYALLREGVGES